MAARTIRFSFAGSIAAVFSLVALAGAGETGEGRLEALQPGLEAACRIAVERVAEEDLALMDGPAAPRILVVMEKARSAEDAAEADRAARVVQPLLFERGFQVTIVGFPVGLPPEGLDSLEIPRDSTWTLGATHLGDRRILRLRATQECGAAVAVPYEEKPWVTDFHEFARARSGMLYFHARSGIEGDAEEARHSAVRGALEEVRLALVERRGQERSLIGRVASRKSRARLEKELADPIIVNNYLADWYLEESRRPYGSVYRGYALVGIPEGEFREWADRVRGWDRSWTRSLLLGLLGLGLLVPAVWLAYLKLDAATDGCFGSWLRLLALGGLAGAGALVFLVLF